MTRVVEVRTPGRLHFGLSCFGGEGRQYGGLGMMVEGAGVTLRVSPAKEFRAVGLHSVRVKEFAWRWAAAQESLALPASDVEVLAAPPDHVGLGVGTQLGLAVAAGLSEFSGIEWRDAATLAQMSGRGQRSAVGTHGFLHGGLLVDAGKLPEEPLGKLRTRVEVPSGWRFVLIRPTASRGLAGHAESQAMSSLPAVPRRVTESLHAIIEQEILPAARNSNFTQFSQALFEYGYRAGECFAAAQGGPFASPEIAKLIEHVRELGYSGVGQSSWGPTVFALTRSQKSATGLVAKLQTNSAYENELFTISRANKSGAAVEKIA